MKNVKITSLLVYLANIFQRAIYLYTNLWNKNVTNDGKILIPYSFHKNFPKKFQFKKWMENMSADIGCVELGKIQNLKACFINYIRVISP